MSSPDSDTSPNQRLGLLLGLLVTAQFAVVVDFSIVQIALPTIRGDLGMSLADSQWIISAYGVTFAGFLLLSGRLSDVYGSKRLFLIGLIIFSLSSLSAGLANTELVLIGSRVVQGVGAAIASATGLAMITRIFSPIGRLNQALGIFTAVSSAGFTAGVVLGGVLTEALGWRWIFFVNVPIGLLGTLLSYRTLPNFLPRQGTGSQLDLPGAFSITMGLMLLVYGLSEVGNGVTDYGTYAVFALAGAVIAAFLVIESRSKAPIIHLGFLRRRTIFFANATALLTFATTVPWIFFMASYLQVLLLYSPLASAAALVPGSLTYFFLGGFGAPRLVRRLGARPVLVGAMLALAAGLFLTSRLSYGSTYLLDVLPAMLVASGGGALSATASNIAALSGTQRGEEGVASGLINTSRQVGGPVGLALVVSVVGVVTHGGGLFGPSPQVLSGLQDAFIAAAGFASLAVLTSLLIPGKSTREGPVSPKPGAPET
jgi:EmrB/QacA subfamily drug resistance transporter